MSFSGHHIWRHVIPICPSVVTVILITWSRYCPISPLNNYCVFSLLQLKAACGVTLQEHANILFLIKISPQIQHPLMILIRSNLYYDGCKMTFQLRKSLHIYQSILGIFSESRSKPCIFTHHKFPKLKFNVKICFHSWWIQEMFT